MRILYGITKSNFGGAQRYVFDLASEAQKRGHETAVLCGGDGVLVQKLKAENIRVISIPGFGRDISWFKDFIGLCFIFKTIWKEKPDVFHINSAKMGGAGIFAGRILRVPHIIFTAHGWAFNEPRPEWQKIVIKFFSWLTVIGAHKTICVSRRLKHDIEHLPFIKHKLLLIRNGIAPFALLSREQARQTLVPSISSETVLIGALSELHPVKGLDVLLEAWKEFKPGRDSVLVLIGGGQEEQKLKNMAQNMSISDSVIFKGFVENARGLLSGFDIFVMPSRSEALPYAPLEAGEASLPVIATRVGGLPEIIENEKTGILVGKENTSELAQALSFLSKNKHIREKLGAALHAFVQENFSREKMFRATFETYE
jgi:glycosyltransferase involved in cell wall biosynthesis